MPPIIVVTVFTIVTLIRKVLYYILPKRRPRSFGTLSRYDASHGLKRLWNNSWKGRWKGFNTRHQRHHCRHHNHRHVIVIILWNVRLQAYRAAASSEGVQCRGYGVGWDAVQHFIPSKKLPPFCVSLTVLTNAELQCKKDICVIADGCVSANIDSIDCLVNWRLYVDGIKRR